MSAGESQGVQVVADAGPNLSFVIPAANENRWSDLLAALISTDPAPIARLLDVDFDMVRREVVVPGQVGRKSDRLDLLLLQGDREMAAIEVKLLSDLGPQQLERYRAAFPTAAQYRVLHPQSRQWSRPRVEAWTPTLTSTSTRSAPSRG